jgi:hypothetical protein
MKLCKDCKYSKGVAISMECWHPKNLKIDHSTGDKTQRLIYCSTLRNQDYFTAIMLKYCGKSARWFEPKYVPARERTL